MTTIITMANVAGNINIEIEGDQLFASWPESLSVESVEFYETMVVLLDIIREKKITKVIVDSNEPKGGILTEKVVNYGLKVVPFTVLRKVAILESKDYHWDNNLVQLINYVKTISEVTLEARMFPNKKAALAWFAH